jgi:spore germination cell wall hydrolase CwlJ-like protein
MLSLDFAEIATIEIIATARIMAAIVPNSGTTNPSATSTSTESVNNESFPCLAVTVYAPSCDHRGPPTEISVANSPLVSGDT